MSLFVQSKAERCKLKSSVNEKKKTKDKRRKEEKPDEAALDFFLFPLPEFDVPACSFGTYLIPPLAWDKLPIKEKMENENEKWKPNLSTSIRRLSICTLRSSSSALFCISACLCCSSASCAASLTLLVTPFSWASNLFNFEFYASKKYKSLEIETSLVVTSACVFRSSCCDSRSCTSVSC